MQQALSPKPKALAYGQGFLLIKGDDVAESRLVFLQNWFEELKRRVPTRYQKAVDLDSVAHRV